MSALSYPIRTRLEWSAVGFILGAILIYVAYVIHAAEGEQAGFAVLTTGLLGFFVVRQFIFAPPTGSVAEILWWHKPGYYDLPKTGGGLRIIRPRGPTFSVIFDLDGDVIGDESLEKGGWKFRPIDSDCHYRMSALAYWLTKLRSPKLPADQQAEIIDHDGTVVGHTTYKSS